MNYLKEYQRFIHSYYLTNGLKITLSIILPSIMALYFGQLELGIHISLGALCISIIDSPGPFYHRRNSMLLGLIGLLFSSLITINLTEWAWFLGIWIILIGFILSYISLYGNRAANIGLCGLLAMVFSISSQNNFESNLEYSSTLFLGGIWYLLFSFLSYRFLPLELSKKALSDCIFKTAQYVQNRSRFYEEPFNEEDLLRISLKYQLELVESQRIARELLLKNKELLKEANLKGRSLILIFIEILDIYDELSATHADYTHMHAYFKESPVLSQIAEFILEFSLNLEEFGKKVAGTFIQNHPIDSMETLNEKLGEIKKQIHDFHGNLKEEGNLLGLLSIRRVERSLTRSLDRFKSMQAYLGGGKSGNLGDLDLKSFIDHEDFSWQLFLSNLNLDSVYFRHAIRVSLALLVGYILLPIWTEHHGYWILLTIVVILKPGFSMSRTRTWDRFLGTIFGAGLSFILLYFLSSDTALFGIMLIFMFLSYSLSNLNYLISVFSTSVFVLIFFHFQNPENLNYVQDRILDTVVGIGISLAAIYFILPNWESSGFPNLISQSIRANLKYLESVNPELGHPGINLNTYKLARKEVQIRLSNLNGALERMSKEPNSHKTHSEEFHKLTLLSLQFSASVSGLGNFLLKNPEAKFNPLLKPYFEGALFNLEKAKKWMDRTLNEDSREIEDYSPVTVSEMVKKACQTLLNDLTHTRFMEIQEGIQDSLAQKELREFSLIHEQLEYLSTLSEDILKECQKIPVKMIPLGV